VKDPYGVVLAIIRADSDVASIAGTKIGAEASEPPCVVLVDLATTRRPFGPGSGRLGMQYWSGAARCYGTDDPSGSILARALAGTVSDALHGHGPYQGTLTRFMARSYAPEVDGLDRDPDTNWPYYTVQISGYFGTGTGTIAPGAPGSTSGFDIGFDEGYF